MTTNNTGNPVEPDGSADPRDLHDNAQNLDKALNGTAVTWPDRKNVIRKSWAGIESEIDSIIASLDTANFTFPTTAAGLEATTNGQYFRVPQGENTNPAFIYYRNQSGAAVVVAQVASSVPHGYQKATAVGGSANAISLTIPGVVVDGAMIFFTATATNTGPTTVTTTNISGGVNTSNVLKEANSPLAAADIVANQGALIVFRGPPVNNWILAAAGSVGTTLSNRAGKLETAAVYPLTSQGSVGDAYTASCITDGSALFSQGRIVSITIPTTNTTATPTLSINSGAVRAIKAPNGGNLNPGDLPAGFVAMLYWHLGSSQWRILFYPENRGRVLSQYQKAIVTSGVDSPNIISLTINGFLSDGTQLTFEPVINNTGPVKLIITDLAGNVQTRDQLKGANTPLVGGEFQANKLAVTQWRGAPQNNFKLVLAGDVTTDIANANTAILNLQSAISDPLSAIRPAFIDNLFGNITFAPGGVKTVVPHQIICTSIGSSIGVGAGSSNGSIYAPNAQFVDELKKQMAQYGNIEIINDNQSIPTQAIQQFSAQLDNSPYATSDFVLIVAGMNDGPVANFNAGLTYPGQQSRLLALIDKCYARGAIPILCTSPHNDVTKITYALPNGVASSHPIRMLNITGAFAFDATNKTITHPYFANPGYGGNILKPGDHLLVGSGPNAGTYTIAAISADRLTVTTVEAIPATDSSSVNIIQVNADQELVLEPPPSRSVVTRDWTGSGVLVSGDVRFWIMNNMFRSVARQKNCFLFDCSQSFMRGVETVGWAGLYIPANFNHFNDAGYTWMGKPIREGAQQMAEQIFLNKLVINNQG